MLPYAVETFTSEEEDILRRYVTNLDQPVFALVNLPEVVKGALFARYSRSSEEPPAPVPRRVRRGPGHLGGCDGRCHGRSQAGRGALREGLLRVRRRFGGPARRCPPGLRTGLQRPDQDSRVGTADGLPRAVDPLHRVQLSPHTGHYRYYRDPICWTRRSEPGTSARWTACSTPMANFSMKPSPG